MLLIEANALLVVLKVIAAVGMALVGARLLWLAHVDRTPHLAARKAVQQTDARRTTQRPVLAAPAPARLAAGLELRRLTDVIEIARGRMQTINSNQRSAAGHLDSAEVALNRLVGEIAAIMPAGLAVPVAPRVQPIPQTAPRHALAA